MRGRAMWGGSALAGMAATGLIVGGGAGQAPVAVVGAGSAAPSSAAGTLGGERGPRGPEAHPFRLSVADVVVSGTAMDVRVRFFWDDLQFAVMESTSDMNFRLLETEEVDAVVTGYIGEALLMEAGGATVPGVLVERGVEASPRLDETMWWYRLSYRLPKGAERLRIRNRLLFNAFEDQRNLVHLKTRSGKERTYYFTWDDDEVAVSVN